MKRCVISADGRFRISKPGFDVDSAATHDLLLHESFFYSQPFLFRYVNCPYSGTSSSTRSQDAPTISFTNPGTELPSVLLYPNDSNSVVSFPGRNQLSPPQSGGVIVVPGWLITYRATTNNITLNFNTTSNSPAPLGAYLVLFRKG